MEKKIGFIGLGIMGKPMCKNLIRAGYSLVVFDINKSAVDQMVADGAQAADSPATLASMVKTIITMLPDGPEVKEVITADDGLLSKAQPGSFIVDMSSIAPLISQDLHHLCALKQVTYIDAPVSGGEPKAIDGTLAVMVGCEERDFNMVRQLLEPVAASVVRTGKVGSGNVTKLANQIIVALNIAAISEAYVLAAKAGVEPVLVFDAIKSGLAGSNVMNAKSHMIMDRNFKPGFKIKLHIKDLTNALNTGHSVGAPLPLTSSVMEMMHALKVKGREENDHCNLAEYFESLANVEVTRK